MDDFIKRYVTSDGEVFETTLDIGKVDCKLYTLYHLSIAEKRVHAGTNKTLQAALNSTKAIAKKNQKSNKNIEGAKFDEYGLDTSVYSERQLDFLRNKMEEFENVYEPSSPFEKESIGILASISLKMNEVRVKMITSDDQSYVRELKDLREMFSNIAGDLKLRPKDKKEVDKSKGRTSLAEIVMRYEARKRSGRREVTEKTKEMDKKMSNLRVEHLDGNFTDNKK